MEGGWFFAAAPVILTRLLLPFQTPTRPLPLTQTPREVPLVLEMPCSYIAERFFTLPEPQVVQHTIAQPEFNDTLKVSEP